MVNYLFLFIIFGIIGWIIDTTYRSIISKKYDSRTQLLFFSPIYAIGGTILIIIYENVKVHFIIQIIIVSILFIALELISGIFSEKIMKKKYWDYSNNKWNFKGYIDALHSFYWIILATLIRIIYPYLKI
ncbi:MAG: putative ABC transporter permease [Nanoarchaeota archaeon]|nr:putative ABC transporter permease [Nanoarchaeota archaeon]